MEHYHTEEKIKVLQALCEDVVKLVEINRQAELREFTRDFYSNVTADDILERSSDMLVEQTLLAWQFLQEFDGDSPKIALLNPNEDADVAHFTRSVVLVLQKDMPFLSDSVRMELTRKDMGVHTVQSVVQLVTRDDSGMLLDRALRIYGDGGVTLEQGQEYEALLYFEIDQWTQSDESVASLQQHLLGVLKEVAVAVDDFEAMKEKVVNIIKELEDAPPPLPADEIEEAKTFLRWTLDHKFTFLGYKQYKIKSKRGKPFIDAIEEDALGIVKVRTQSMRDKYLDELNPAAQAFVQAPMLVSFAKSGTLARVHRPAYPDYIAIRRFNSQGEVIGEHGFLGLYTLPVYTQRVGEIPIIRRKVDEVMRRSELYPLSHEGKELERVLEVYPRDELFQTDPDQLYATATRIAQIKERQSTKLFVRRDPYGKFVICFVYMPRESYNTKLRKKIQHILCDAFQALNSEFTTYFGESVLVRTQFTLRTNPGNIVDFDREKLEREIIRITRSWDEELTELLIEEQGRAIGSQVAHQFKNAFPSSYKDDFPATIGLLDIGHLHGLNEEQPLAMWFYQNAAEANNIARFALFHRDTPVPLSDIIPILENMGLHVIGEHPYRICDGHNDVYWKHDFDLTYAHGGEIDAEQMNREFVATVQQVWNGRIYNDYFNRLVLVANLKWREVLLLRAFSRYLKQIGMALSRKFIVDTFIKYPQSTSLLVLYFKTKFDPDFGISPKKREQQLSNIEAEYVSNLDSVESFTEDLTLRRYLELCQAILRTNYFQTDTHGGIKPYVSMKIAPRLIPEMPLPAPMFEIYVYSRRIEGVHLRGGKIARGGLRWSDREEDYRTEVLGLVKAQQVKNAVIVPVGAKGGFVAKNLHAISDRDAFMREGIECYKIFIRGLLDLTDNRLDDQIVAPERVLRYDDDDPYLVVAADKGTAKFSDIANEQAKEFGFWLGDAFASGGSQGYDHKAMGITARGAWVSVQRHFREIGIDIQNKDFTVVGVGDMGGDVFGNGMLLSPCIKLVAAFNHLHIFIDPNPDVLASFKERASLFESPKAGWADYNKSLISKGGGVFLRTAKSISISPEMKKRFSIKDSKLAPNELLRALLKSPVDLLWNGGIGTYVKASNETELDVGDRANDAIRVNGKEIRAKVIGEGGNLGATQLGRIEYAMHGGLCNTDFIDNAGGVDCSDHEVNIKILLDTLISSGQINDRQRNRVLAAMTDEVAELVLTNNYRQVEAISMSMHMAEKNMHAYRRFIGYLEEQGKLNRRLEFLPSEEEFAAREQSGQMLTRPELSVLTSYSKANLKEVLIESNGLNDPYMAKIVETAFPAYLLKRYKAAIYQHRLQREIIATQLANEIVNTLGITFVSRMQEFTGASTADVASTYVIARNIFDLQAVWLEIEKLDNLVPAELQAEMLTQQARVIAHSVRWLLRRRTEILDIPVLIKRYASGIVKLGRQIPDSLTAGMESRWQQRQQSLIGQGVPAVLAGRMATSYVIYFALDIVDVALATGSNPDSVARAFFQIAGHLGLGEFRDQINKIDAQNVWHHMAKESFRDDLDAQLRALTQSLFEGSKYRARNVDKRVSDWISDQTDALTRWSALQAEFKRSSEVDLALFSVAIRELTQLAQVSAGQ